MKSVLVTGGAGFIGSALCRHLVGKGGYHVVNVDKLTYAGNLSSLRDIQGDKRYCFYQTDILEDERIAEYLRRHEVDIVIHLAAESHVDRSIDNPHSFIETNVVGTYRLLNAALDYWRGLTGDKRDFFRFHHVSTDEVFGELELGKGIFTEYSPYAPSSPYSASKAASDHLVRAWHTTYGLPVVLSNCSNNYGPYHFPEKLIPLIILNAIDGKPLPVYGAGANVRDWLFVDDHARALEVIATVGAVGESYNVGGRAERSNLEVVELVCDILQDKKPLPHGRYRDLIRFVSDRPGHDLRYAIDPTKVETQLAWRALETFESGLNKTIDWFLENDWWWRPIREKKYSGDRLGAKGSAASL